MSQVLCPHCQKSIDVDQVVTHQLQAKLEQQLKRELWEKAQAEAQKKISAEQQQTLAKLEAQLKAEQEKANLEKQQAVTKLEMQLKAEQEKLAFEKQQATAKLEAQLKVEQQKAQLEKQQLLEAQQRAAKAEATEIELRKEQRELEIQKQQFQLDLERKLSERLKEEQERQAKLIGDKFSLKELEYQKQIADMKKLVEEATRKADTVSQQLQGEVLELKLERLLHEAFQHDKIEEVKKGQLGGDVIQTVRTVSGKTVGKILWEFKQTEKFSDKWLGKLREDAREAGGAVPVLVTRSLPSDVVICGERDRVWITGVDFVLPLAHLLRQQLLAVDQEKRVSSGRDVKMEMLYQYVNSHEFRGRVEGIVESYRELSLDLESEQRAMHKIWKKRAVQLKRMAINTAYLYGEMQGVVGSSLPEIAGLELASGETSTASEIKGHSLTEDQPSLLTDTDA